MEFWGYRRSDGKVGVRNKILILPASICATDTARIVASQVEGAVTFHNQNGCSQVPSDMKLTMDTIAGMAANPNVYGTVVISLGCEGCQMELVVEEIEKRTNKPLEKFVIQENGGTIATVERATRAAKRMAQDASLLQREEFPISELIVGTECGGSDQTSGLASNPLIGEACDRLVDMGATAVLSETTEFIGAEHILARRGRSPEVSRRIYDIVHRFENALKLVGEDVRDGNPSPGNMEGGLTTRRKSLWAASTRVDTVRWRRCTSTQRSSTRRALSSWTPRATTRPPWRPWWPAVHRWCCSPRDAARPRAILSRRSSS